MRKYPPAGIEVPAGSRPPGLVSVNASVMRHPETSTAVPPRLWSSRNSRVGLGPAAAALYMISLITTSDAAACAGPEATKASPTATDAAVMKATAGRRNLDAMCPPALFLAGSIGPSRPHRRRPDVPKAARRPLRGCIAPVRGVSATSGACVRQPAPAARGYASAAAEQLVDVVHAGLVDHRQAAVRVDAGRVAPLHPLADVEVLGGHLLAGRQVGSPPVVGHVRRSRSGRPGRGCGWGRGA